MNVLSPDTFGTAVDNNNYKLWRMYLKRELLFRRKYRSDFSGKLITLYTGCHLHEGILTRAAVPRSVWWHYKLFHEYNCFLLLPEEHTPQPPSVEWCIQRAYLLYGKDKVQEWFYSLPWKNKPPFLLSQ